MNIHIVCKKIQETPRRVAKFHENRPRDVEKSVVGKTKQVGWFLRPDCAPVPNAPSSECPPNVVSYSFLRSNYAFHLIAEGLTACPFLEVFCATYHFTATRL